MAELILIRHSISQPNPEINAHEWELSKTGRMACKILAEKLRPYAIRQIYSSSEAKAVETGQLLAASLSLSCKTVPELGETRHEGFDYMANIADFRERVREAMRHPSEILFGEESFDAARKRFLNAMEHLLSKHPDETLALVSHGRVLSMVLAQFTGEDPVSIWDSLRMPAYAVLSLPKKEIRAFAREIV